LISSKRIKNEAAPAIDAASKKYAKTPGKAGRNILLMNCIFRLNP